MKFRKYQARSPQLWSNISEAYYRNRFAYVDIIRYNYGTPPFDVIIPENTEIKIPLKESVVALQVIGSSSLPPWKR
jgi:hypothetical protein